MFKFLSILSVCFFSTFSWAQDPLPKDSVYQITTDWKNQDDKVIQLKDFRGEPIILTMVYLTCPHACPMTISKLQDIEKKIQAKGIAKYRFVLASFDFERDRPRQLKSYMNKRKLEESHWIFLTGSKDEQIRELAIVLGISYKKLADGDFSHSNVISLLDLDGRISAKAESLNASDSAIIEKIGQISGK